MWVRDMDEIFHESSHVGSEMQDDPYLSLGLLRKFRKQMRSEVLVVFRRSKEVEQLHFN